MNKNKIFNKKLSSVIALALVTTTVFGNTVANADVIQDEIKVKAIEENLKSSNVKIEIDVQKSESDKNKVNIKLKNVEQLVKSVQLSLRIDGNALFSENSINLSTDLRGDVKKEVVISEKGKVMDIFIVSNRALNTSNGSIDIGEITVKDKVSSLPSRYKIDANKASGPAYTFVLSSNNKTISGSDIGNLGGDLSINTAPELSLNKDLEGVVGNNIYIQRGSIFNIPEAKKFVKAIDAEDGNISNEINVQFKNGKLDTSNVSTSIITYSVTDSDGDETILEQPVMIVDSIPDTEGPDIEEPDDINPGFAFGDIEVTDGFKVSSEDLDEFLEGFVYIDKNGAHQKPTLVTNGGYNPNVAGTYTFVYKFGDQRVEFEVTVAENGNGDGNEGPLVPGLPEPDEGIPSPGDPLPPKPPVVVPPIVKPPVVVPPIVKPPVVVPPIVKPPTGGGVEDPLLPGGGIIVPPTVKPPTVKPPTVKPPTVKPPMVKPPTVKPPMVKPPTVKPPMVIPPTVKPPILGGGVEDPLLPGGGIIVPDNDNNESGNSNENNDNNNNNGNENLGNNNSNENENSNSNQDNTGNEDNENLENDYEEDYEENDQEEEDNLEENKEEVEQSQSSKEQPIISLDNFELKNGHIIEILNHTEFEQFIKQLRCFDRNGKEVKFIIDRGNYEPNKLGDYDIKITAKDSKDNVKSIIVKVSVVEERSEGLLYDEEFNENQNVNTNDNENVEAHQVAGSKNPSVTPFTKKSDKFAVVGFAVISGIVVAIGAGTAIIKKKKEM